ncbi:MAG: hypothetical protein NZ601_01225 [candidate division WOR-3 bacterium]|nr:hypothetical protein [candidate division WOR-3 bacterium]MDW7988323.1 hypothetical protein [candidate division WOR-3 bacterium]
MVKGNSELEKNLAVLEKKIDEAVVLINNLREENQLLKDKLTKVQTKLTEVLQRINYLLDNLSKSL